MLNTGAYVRGSTLKIEQLHSIEAQKEFFNRYIKENPEWKFVKIYADEGITGTNTKKRKAFNEMMKDAELGRLDLIVTKEISRFARNTLDSIYYTRKLKALGVGVFFVNDNLNTLDPDAELRLTIMACLAQEESRRCSERTKWGQTQSMKNGTVFGTCQYGYFLQNGKLTINEAEAEVVRLIFNLYLEGCGSSTIKLELENRGILSPTGLKEWQEVTILRMLRNEKYRGDLVQRKRITPDFLSHDKIWNDDPDKLITVIGNHEAIIDTEKFEAVQREIARRTTTTKGQRAKYSNRYCWSCKIECAECQSHYKRKLSNANTKYEKPVWACTNYLKYGVLKNRNGLEVGCNSKYLPEKTLEDAFLSVLNAIVKDKEEIMLEVQKAVIQAIEQSNDMTTQAEALKSKKAKIEAKKKRLVELFVGGTVDREQYDTLHDSYIAEIEKIDVEIEKIENQAEEKEDLKKRVNAVNKAIKSLVFLEEFSPEICRKTLDKVVVESRKSLTFFLRMGENQYPFFIPLDLRIRQCV